jgi:hypothetical protein
MSRGAPALAGHTAFCPEPSCLFSHFAIPQISPTLLLSACVSHLANSPQGSSQNIRVRFMMSALPFAIGRLFHIEIAAGHRSAGDRCEIGNLDQ